MIEPQTELAYTHISGADYTMSNGIRVNQDNENGLIGRVGFRLGREYNRDNAARHSQWYVKMDLLHEFAGDHGISMTSSDASQYYHHDADEQMLADLGRWRQCSPFRPQLGLCRS